MQTIYPGAAWKPLGQQTEPSIATPRWLVFHTMVGFLRSTDAMFRREGYQGVESTWGVGGPWDKMPDGTSLDGVAWQWQDITHQADAQADGNAHANSIETSDGGDPDRPWSAKQLARLVDITVWWCRQTGHPCRLIRSLSDGGIAYHRQFSVWNPDGHSCPGDVRLAQLIDYVIPTAARILAGGAPPPDPEPTRETEDMDLYENAERPTDVWHVGTFKRKVDPHEVEAYRAKGGKVGAMSPSILDRVPTLPAWLTASTPPAVTIDVPALADALAARLPAEQIPSDVLTASVETGVRNVFRGV